jgi:hypothetical protein
MMRAGEPLPPLPPPDNAVEILQFSAAPSTVDAGERAALTFRFKNAHAARIEPEVGALPSLAAGTVGVNPREPTTYSLVATGADGRVARQTVFINVRRPPRPYPVVPRVSDPVVPRPHSDNHVHASAPPDSSGPKLWSPGERISPSNHTPSGPPVTIPARHKTPPAEHSPREGKPAPTSSSKPTPTPSSLH